MKKTILSIFLFLLLPYFIMAAAKYVQDLYLFGEASLKGACRWTRGCLKDGKWPLLSWSRKDVRELIGDMNIDLQEARRSF
jgi:hypothetical protein